MNTTTFLILIVTALSAYSFQYFVRVLLAIGEDWQERTRWGFSRWFIFTNTMPMLLLSIIPLFICGGLFQAIAHKMPY